MLVALGDLSSAQAKGTEATNLAATQLLDYCATHSEASIRYCASEMALQIHSNASYLSVAKGRSRTSIHRNRRKIHQTHAQQWRPPHHLWHTQTRHVFRR
jgi:hypothetical protein